MILASLVRLALGIYPHDDMADGVVLVTVTNGLFYIVDIDVPRNQNYVIGDHTIVVGHG